MKEQHAEDLDEARRYRSLAIAQIAELERDNEALTAENETVTAEKSNLEADIETINKLFMKDRRKATARISELDEENNSLRRVAEETERAFNQQLSESRASNDQLLAENTALRGENKTLEENLAAQRLSSYCDIKLANEEKDAYCEELERAKEKIRELSESNRTMETAAEQFKREHKHLEASRSKLLTLQSESEEIISELQESKQSLDKSVRAMEKAAEDSKWEHKQQLEESRSSYEKLLADHNGLKSQSELNKKEFDLLIQMASDNIASLRESKQSLEQSVLIKEELVRTMKAAAEDSKRELTQQLEESRSSYGNLLAEHNALKSQTELKEKELHSLGAETQIASNSIISLEESEQSLENLIGSKDEQIETMKTDYETLENKCKSQENANQLKDDEVQSSKEELRQLKKEVAGVHQKLEESKSSYAKLLGEHHALKRESDLKGKELQSFGENIKNASDTIASLQVTKQSLEQSNGSKDEKLETMKTDHLALEDKCRRLEEASLLKDNEMQSLKGDNTSLEQKVELLEKENATMKETISELNTNNYGLYGHINKKRETIDSLKLKAETRKSQLMPNEDIDTDASALADEREASCSKPSAKSPTYSSSAGVPEGDKENFAASELSSDHFPKNSSWGLGDTLARKPCAKATTTSMNTSVANKANKVQSAPSASAPNRRIFYPVQNNEDSNTNASKATLANRSVSGSRKRKSRNFFVTSELDSEEGAAQRRGRPQKKPAAQKATKAKKSKPRDTSVKPTVGEVGYKFKKWFGPPYNKWYDGEVMELVKPPPKNGVKSHDLWRRCQYTDGDVEDITIKQMKQQCVPRDM